MLLLFRNKYKNQRVTSKTSGLRHRMIYRDKYGFAYIRTAQATGLNDRFIPVYKIENDLWAVK